MSLRLRYTIVLLLVLALVFMNVPATMATSLTIGQQIQFITAQYSPSLRIA